MKLNNKGAVNFLVIAVVAAVVLLSGVHFTMPAIFQKKPATLQLQKAQDDLDKSRRETADAKQALADALAKDLAVQKKQLDYTQQASSATDQFLNMVKPEEQTPEIRLATQMSHRAVAGFEAFRGKLDPQLQVELDQWKREALSSVEAERDAYKSRVAEKDHQLVVSESDRKTLGAQVVSLSSKYEVAQKSMDAKDALVAEKTKQVSVWAQSKYESEQKAGSLDAYAGNLVRVIIGLAVVYFLGHYALPSFQQEFPGSKVLTWMDKAFKSISTSRA